MGLYISTAAVESRKWVTGFFTSFRTQYGDGWPTLYGPNKNPVTADVLESGFIYAACIIAISFIVILPGIRGREKAFVSCRFFYSLFVFLIIMLSLFGQEWETSKIHTKTQYKSGIGKEIEAEIGIKIGLHSVNITLKGTPEKQVNETINYNERFHWSYPWTQGRNFFGPFAGEINQEYRAAQYKGLPYPILWIAEYFTFDGEGIRWGRHYRQAGFFAHIAIWTAFPLWILTNILFFMVIRYGAYFMSLTGLLMVLGNIIFSSIRNVNDLAVPFEDAILAPKYGWCYYINLITGISCILLGMLIVFMDLRYPGEISSFFGIDVLQDAEEFYADSKEFAHLKRKESRPKSKAAAYNGTPSPSTEQLDSDDIYQNEDIEEPAAHRESSYQPVFRKKTTKGIGRFAKSARKPRAAPRRQAPSTDDEDDGELYENVSGLGDVSINLQSIQE